ncbi:MAG: phosphatase PAP2 family protein [Candidatus Cloacimonetes bacterium]|jgi:membrane-associated PAP2 superfamily phosphatase|nr:phosphatase PAP2 family protein [Candidatus Cloacimonadota bacterium]MCB5287451.1 phosphatase PAP2 family protein [Candidatus Cloacimonadota bacterium]MCK9185068.1 phosphatase PAP2 family protein [Candidatus Cloacimonadota bacterium]MCK9584985.1 phosphatase PAP2 family protein [Candidatus Cloacimonadota bacterium]MDY0229772.1 phosphatase PAP2 family protein [Candidatus Cloacimonadaceae bacterium]
MTQAHNEQAPLRGRLFLYSFHFWIPLLLLSLTAIIFNRYDLDLWIQNYYYRDGWHGDKLKWAKLLYHYGNIPAIITAVGALLLYIRSFSRGSGLLIYRKMALYLSLAMIIGPGLIVNTILKDNWGRPRPRELELYGGRYDYEAPLRIDPVSPGKSFPCGHATVGFYFYALALLFAQRKRRHYLLIALFATLYGLLIGWVRVMQGGHFASDVIFSGGIVYLSSWALWRLMKLDVKPFYVSSAPRRKLKTWQWLIIIIGLIVLLVGVSLATPYSVKQAFGPLEEGRYELSVDIKKANVNVSFADSMLISNEVYAFGFPGSRARLKRKQSSGVLSIEQYLKGWFTELQVEIAVVIDTLSTESMLISLDEGEINLEASESQSRYLHLSEDARRLTWDPDQPLIAEP